ncbi:MAG TPA: magnesium transporter [Pseudomonadales bacterium]|nr:magnesium transporter [Pseudomonadales bacterium]
MAHGGPDPGFVERDTAGAHMVARIPRAIRSTPVDAVIETLRGQHFECADTVFVTDDAGRLEGIVRIAVLLADGGRRIEEIMEPEHEAVRLGDDQEAIAKLAIDLAMIAVPVVDDGGVLIGAVPPEALFRILREEHMEDLQRLAGITPHRMGPEVALDAPLLDRFRRRMPWLLAGLLASTLVTFVMASFEATLAANLSVAFFVPALVYVAGAIGTQAVSVAVRGLASGSVALGPLLRDELLIGVAVGGCLGLVAGAAVLAFFGAADLAVAVGLSVLGGGAVSAIVGFLLPWSFERLGLDPALGSGPMCTIIQDVASLYIYFLMVSALIL